MGSSITSYFWSTTNAFQWVSRNAHLCAELNYGSKLWAIILGIIFAIIAISLAIASWTRWGQSKPLTKCVALAVLAHVWLLMYAYGTRIIHPGNGDGPGAAGLPIDQAVTFQMLPSPAPLLSAQDDANTKSDEQSETEQIVAPEWAKPLEVPLPDLLPKDSPDPSPSNVDVLANVDFQLPAELLDIGDMLQLPMETSEDAAQVQPIPLIPTVESSVSEMQLPPLDTAGQEQPTTNPMVVPEDMLGNDLTLPSPSAEPQGNLVSLSRLDQGMPSLAATSAKELTPKTEPQPSRDIYQLRFSPQRSQTAYQNGGDAKSEAAVAAALAYLARTQQRDGSWNAALYGAGRETGTLNENRYGTGGKADTAMTGLSLLAFLGDGHTHLNGTYQAMYRGT